MKALGLPVLLLFLFVSPADAQQIYKWKDEKGQWHFDQNPPATVQSERIEGGNFRSDACKGELQAMDIENRTPAREKQLIDFIEARLTQLDCGRIEASFMNDLTQLWEKLLREAIRVKSPQSDEVRRELLQSKIRYCEKEALWRAELAKVERLVKGGSGGIFPPWFIQNRNWQKLDQAAKRDTVRIPPEECRKIYKE